MTMEQELAKLRAENEALKALHNKPLTVKISDKGAVCVYGMGRFPVALYRSQWMKLFAHAEDIQKFIGQHTEALDIAEKQPRVKVAK